jgi:hypothetical protein
MSAPVGPEPTNEYEDGPPLTVEHRLRIALSTLDCLKRLSSLADEPHAIRLFDDVPSFARVVWQCTRNTEVHLLAMSAALPPECLNVDAPLVSGGAR